MTSPTRPRDLADEALADEALAADAELDDEFEASDEAAGSQRRPPHDSAYQWNWRGPRGARLHLDGSDLDRVIERLERVRDHMDGLRSRADGLLTAIRRERPRDDAHGDSADAPDS